MAGKRMVAVEHDAGAHEGKMRLRKPDDRRAVGHMDERHGEPTLFGLVPAWLEIRSSCRSVMALSCSVCCRQGGS